MTGDTSNAPAIRRTATHPVAAANPPSGGYPSRWRLGPLDYYVGLGIPIQVVFVYDQPSAAEGTVVPLDRLRKAMSLVLDHYPHFTGRLSVDDSDKQPHVTSLGSGAELVEATCEGPLSAFRGDSGEYIITKFPKETLSPYEPTPEYLSSHPFFAIQHTRFSCGGVALAVRMAHAVVDGEGFFEVWQDLANLYRQLASGSESPQLDHSPSIKGFMADWETQASRDELDQALSIQPPQYNLIGDDFKSGSNGVTISSKDSPKEEETAEKSAPAPPPDPIQGRVLRFSAEQQSSLKELGTDPAAPQGEYITTFDALCAYMAKETYRARTSPDRQPPTSPDKCNFLTPSSWRKAFGLPAHHSPNSCFVNFCDLSPQDVLDGPLHKIARVVHQVSRNLSLADAHQQLKWLCAQPDKSKAQMAFQYGDGSLLLSSWAKMNLYEAAALDNISSFSTAEFQQPSVTFTPFTEVSLVDGLGYFLPPPPSSVKDGKRAPLELALALKESVWREMDRNQDQMFTYVG